MEVAQIISGHANVESIRSQMFDVVKVQLHPNMEGFASPNSFGIYKSDGGQALGVLGKDFLPTQPKFLLDNFETCLIENDADLNKLEYHSFKGGAKIALRCPIRPIEFTNKAKLQDITNVYVNLGTGFDGFTKTSLYLTVERLVCLNGMKATKTEFTVSFKNTKGNLGKTSSLCIDVAKSISSIKTLEAGFRHLNSIDVSGNDVDAFLLKVLGYNRKDYNDLHLTKQKTLDRINESLGIEMARSGNTLWGVLNGFTHYTNHIAEAENRADYVYMTSGMKMNDTAQRVAYEMAEM